MKTFRPSDRPGAPKAVRPAGAPSVDEEPPRPGAHIPDEDWDAELRALLHEAYPALRPDVPAAEEAAEAERFARRVVSQLPPRRSLAIHLLEALWSPLSLWVVVGILLVLLRHPLLAAAQQLVASLVRLEMPPQDLIYAVVTGLGIYLFLMFDSCRDAERR